MRLLLFLMVGLLAGWLGGQLIKNQRFKKKRFGPYGVLGVGVLVAVVGGVLYSLCDFAGIVPGDSLIGALLTASAGAAALLWWAIHAKAA